MGERAPKKTWALSADQIKLTSGVGVESVRRIRAAGLSCVSGRIFLGPADLSQRFPLSFSTHTPHTRSTMKKAEEGKKKKKKMVAVTL